MIGRMASKRGLETAKGRALFNQRMGQRGSGLMGCVDMLSSKVCVWRRRVLRLVRYMYLYYVNCKKSLLHYHICVNSRLNFRKELKASSHARGDSAQQGTR